MPSTLSRIMREHTEATGRRIGPLRSVALRLWPWFWQHRGGFFAAHCHCNEDGRYEWTLEESLAVPSALRGL